MIHLRMDVQRGLKLGPYEQFELWLGALHLHQRRKKCALSDSQDQKDPNYREDLRISLQILKNLTALSPQAIEMELEDLGAHQNRGMAAMVHDGLPAVSECERELRVFSRFQDTLGRYRTLCHSLIRVRYVSEQQFESFSHLLLDHLRDYLRSAERKRLARQLIRNPMTYILDRHVLLHIDKAGVREQLALVLGRFVRSISALSYVRTELGSSFRPMPIAALLNCIYFRLMKLIRLLDDSRTYLQYGSLQWSEAATMTAAALKLEVRTAFRNGFRDLETESDPAVQYVQLEELSGLVMNTCQEAFINLARTLNPAFDEFELFGGLYRRYEESVMLLDSLVSLYQLVSEPPVVSADEKWQDVLREFDEFQGTCIRSLFARDRHSMEEFRERLNAVSESNRDHVLHQFEVYLSTLVGEIRKRAIFSKFERHKGDRTEPQHDDPSGSRRIINW